MQSLNPMKNLKLIVKILRVGTTNIYFETKVWKNKKVRSRWVGTVGQLVDLRAISKHLDKNWSLNLSTPKMGLLKQNVIYR